MVAELRVRDEPVVALYEEPSATIHPLGELGRKSWLAAPDSVDFAPPIARKLSR